MSMTENVTTTDSLEMSDEDFLNSPPPSEESEQELNPEPQQEAEEEEDQQEEESQEESEEDDPSEEEDEEPEVDTEDTPAEDEPSEAEGESEGSDEDKEKPEQKPKGRKAKAEAELEDLYKPFKANGKEIAVKSVDEARRLMQQGLNYAKKMEQLKPHKRILQTLEKKGIDESKLNYALDILEGKPEAIAKLVQEHNLQEHDFYEEKQYQPTDHLVPEAEVRVREAFDEIQSSPNCQRVIELISSGWDTKSAQTFVDNPAYIKVIADHMDRGEFDLIAEAMERERAVNGSAVSHFSDLELYCAIGDALQKQGHLAKPKVSAVPKASAPKPSKQKNRQPQVNASKIAPTVKQASNKQAEINWLDLPDDQVK